MGKVDGELKVIVGVLYNMILNGCSDSEKNRMRDYVFKLKASEKSYKDNNITQLKKKYKDIGLDHDINIPATVKRKAMVETRKIIEGE